MENSIAQLKKMRLAVCGLARNCASKLPATIRFVETLSTYFESTIIAVVENDSKDKTRSILNNWADSCSSVFIIDGRVPKDDSSPDTKANPYYSFKRVSRLAALRNQYLDFLKAQPVAPDFVMVLDFDVDRISLEGVLDSFVRESDWDVATAYGYSLSPTLQERYHDTYALIPLGEENIPQLEASLKYIQRNWRQDKASSELVKVYSAFGGLAIYKYQQIINLRYSVCPNGDERVEARCEHFSIAKELQKNGYQRIVINPKMHLRFQTIGDAVFKKAADLLNPKRGV
jgi:hypothetical protein